MPVSQDVAGMPPSIFGMHDFGSWRDIFKSADKPGWVMFNQVVGRQAVETNNQAFADWAKDGYGILARLVNAPPDSNGKGEGSIPQPDAYDDFAKRCADFVERSSNCRIWFIGNEMNIDRHWPTGRQIEPKDYAECFNRVYKAIKAVQPDAWVIPSGLNPRYKHPSTVRFTDALEWFQTMLQGIEAFDGFDIHACFPLANGRRDAKILATQTTEADGIEDAEANSLSRSRLYEMLVTEFELKQVQRLFGALKVEYYGVPGRGVAGRVIELIKQLERENRIQELVENGIKVLPTMSWNDIFEEDASPDWIEGAYTFDHFLLLVPPKFRNLPVFLTHATPPEVWPGQSDGWMQYAFTQVNRWNRHPEHQLINALLPFRWEGTEPDGRPDPWNLNEKTSYHDDLRKALGYDFGWKGLYRELPTVGLNYQAEIAVTDPLPQEVWPGDDFLVDVMVKNTGTRVWGLHSLKLQQWLVSGTSKSGNDHEFDRDMAPGDEQTIKTSIKPGPGDDAVEWELIGKRLDPYANRQLLESHLTIKGGKLRLPLKIRDLASLGLDDLLEKLESGKLSFDEGVWTIEAIGRKLQSYSEEEIDVEGNFDRIQNGLIKAVLSDADDYGKQRKAALKALYYLSERDYHRDDLEFRIKNVFVEERIDRKWVSDLAESRREPDGYREWLSSLLLANDDEPDNGIVTRAPEVSSTKKKFEPRDDPEKLPDEKERQPGTGLDDSQESVDNGVGGTTKSMPEDGDSPRAIQGEGSEAVDPILLGKVFPLVYLDKFTLSSSANLVLDKAVSPFTDDDQSLDSPLVTTSDLFLSLVELGQSEHTSGTTQFLAGYISQSLPDLVIEDEWKQVIAGSSTERSKVNTTIQERKLISSEVEGALTRAQQYANQTGDGGQIHIRHLLASLLFVHPDRPPNDAQQWLVQNNIDSDSLCEDFLSYMHHQGVPVIEWNRILLGEAADVSWLIDYSPDNVRQDKDLIGIDREVTAFARLIAARTVPPPLAIGLFGEWGSGKTFFMRMLRNKIEELAVWALNQNKMQKDLPYYKRIVQVEFNAWQYIEGNLWASLVQHILDNLSIAGQPERSASEELRDDLIKKLGHEEREQQQASEAEEKALIDLGNTNDELKRIRSEIDEESNKLAALATEGALRNFALTAVRDQVNNLLTELGFEEVTASARELELALDEAQEVLEQGSTIITPLVKAKDGRRRTIFLVGLIIVSLLVGYLVARHLPLLTNEFQKTIAGLGTSTAALLSTGAIWVRNQARWMNEQLTNISNKRQQLEKELSSKLEEKTLEANQLELKLQTLNVEYNAAQRKNEAAQQRVLSARDELANATSASLLEGFVKSRAESNVYRDHLGIPAIIRQDFETISGLMEIENWKLAPKSPDDDRVLWKDEEKYATLGEEHAEEAVRINRIVLYIDDLDRCPPNRVVDVLQAIHLMLAFPLFVVVVGVDARWITRSLEARYRALLHADDGSGSDTQFEELFGKATTDDYLEKIFQIPYWLRPMDKSAAQKMIRGLLPAEETEADEQTGRRPPGELRTEEERSEPDADKEEPPEVIVNNGDEQTGRRPELDADKEEPPEVIVNNGDEQTGRRPPGELRTEEDRSEPDADKEEPPEVIVNNGDEEELPDTETLEEVIQANGAGVESKIEIDQEVLPSEEDENGLTYEEDEEKHLAEVEEELPSKDEAEEPSPEHAEDPKQEVLDIGLEERMYIEKLGPLLSRSPRALKRFINVYRLLKAGLLSHQHRLFLREHSVMSDYQAVLLLLAIDTGVPKIGPDFFETLRDQAGENRAAREAKKSGDRRSVPNSFAGLIDKINVAMKDIDESELDTTLYKEKQADWAKLMAWLQSAQDNSEKPLINSSLELIFLDGWARRVVRHSFQAHF
jgi:hypothetical protein